MRSTPAGRQVQRQMNAIRSGQAQAVSDAAAQAEAIDTHVDAAIDAKIDAAIDASPTLSTKLESFQERIGALEQQIDGS